MSIFYYLHRKKRLRFIVLLAITTLLFYLIFLLPQQQYYAENHVEIDGNYFIKPIEINDFALINTQHKTFTKKDLIGKWTILYFGFMHCDKICPITMETLNQAYKILEKHVSTNDLPQVIFVSIDPERDSIHELNNFVISFNSKFLAAKGSTSATNNIKKQFYISSEKKTNGTTENSYTLDHSPEIVLVNPEAKIQAYFSYPQNYQKLAKDYQLIVAKLRFNKNKI